MVKKRVVGTFLALIFLAGLIFFVQSINYKGVSGFSVSGTSVSLITEQVISGKGEGFDMRINSAFFEEKILRVDYNLEDNLGNNHDVEVEYLIHDSSGRGFESGKSKVILSENQEMQYSLSILVNDNLPVDSYLTLYAFDGDTEKRALIPLLVGASLITGSAVGEEKTNSLIFFMTMFIALLFLFYCIKLVEAHKLRKNNIQIGNNDRFIRV